MKLRRVLAAALLLSVGTLATPATVKGHGGEAHSVQDAVAERVEERIFEALGEVEQRRSIMQNPANSNRQAICLQNQDSLADTMKGLSEHTSRHLRIIDSVRENVKQYYETYSSKGLSNYSERLTVVNDAYTASQIEAATTSSLSGRIDCSDPDVVVSVLAFRNSLDVANDLLFDYHAAVVDLIDEIIEAEETN